MNKNKAEITGSVALSLMKTNKSVEERAESFFNSVKRNIQRDIIDALLSRKEGIEDKLFELKDFSLSTDLNKGIYRMTKEDCEKRFKDIIQLEYDLKLIELELEAKKESFEKYFGTEPATVDTTEGGE